MASKTIWKFPVPVRDRFALAMPKNAEVLTVQSQRGEPMMWALLDPGAEREPRTFAVHGTGYDFDDEGYAYVGTFQLIEHGLVFHLFEIEEGRDGK